jgi:hypothetical protein
MAERRQETAAHLPNASVENRSNFFSTKHVTADKIKMLSFKTRGRKV